MEYSVCRELFALDLISSFCSWSFLDKIELLVAIVNSKNFWKASAYYLEETVSKNNVDGDGDGAGAGISASDDGADSAGASVEAAKD
ncbi:hypothetical protein CJ030_MR7G011826 [Morella rubra]|uniref:Uncharacterized protein n=1 Tax=Morella rubra TaxID=262757 RepID=A0A6A1V107_9ROSI|nr:hypothetical protein CJ030_MR7G011826 [Morella rubra]